MGTLFFCSFIFSSGEAGLPFFPNSGNRNLACVWAVYVLVPSSLFWGLTRLLSFSSGSLNLESILEPGWLPNTDQAPSQRCLIVTRIT